MSSQLRGIGLPLVGGTDVGERAISQAARLCPRSRRRRRDRARRIADFRSRARATSTLQNDSVALHRMVGRLGGTYARVDGTIARLSSGAPAYALRADVPAAQIARALHAFHLPNYMTDGSFNAQLASRAAPLLRAFRARSPCRPAK